jgi:hypothetical protein
MPDGRITRRLLITVAFLRLTGCMGSTTVDVFAPRVWFVEPRNNDLVTSPVRVVFGVQSLDVVPACPSVPCTIIPGAGHHHLIIDSDRPGRIIPFGMPIPFNANVVHYGGGQVAMDVTLPPGKHKLTAQFADSLHRVCCTSLQPNLQPPTIEVTVIEFR